MLKQWYHYNIYVIFGELWKYHYIMENCFIKVGAIVNQAATFAINDTNFYEPVVTLSTQDDIKLLQQSK